jgi:AcrR family transcriptional regulator
MAVKRAAHRPSRKHEIVAATLRLYASIPREAIAVGDIAAESKMTVAALYYHYATKEEILLHGLTAFADDFAEETSAYLKNDPAAVQNVVVHLLDWMRDRHDAAAVWFAYSNGLSTAVEEARRTTNGRVLGDLIKAVKKANPQFPLPHASVVAAALLAQIDVCARAWLANDEQCSGVAENDFRSAVAGLSARIISTPV